MRSPIVEKLATGEWSPDEFRSHLVATGGPLVEHVAAGEVDVTFVDEPGPDTTVNLATVIGPNIGFNTIDDEFAPVRGTPFHVLTIRMRADLRFAYVFRRSGPAHEGARVADPFNPSPRFSQCSVDRFSGASVLSLPDASPLPWLDEAEARPARAIEPAVLMSEVLGTERRIWVSTPPAEFVDERALPFVIHLDGTPEHSAPSVRDALLRAGLIRASALVLVDQPGPQRNQELLCDPAFSQMLVDELVPWLRSRYPLSHDPRDVALAGESFGGVCAAWTVLRHPATFGNAILQSPSLGYHPDGRWGTGAGELSRRVPLPMVMADFAATERAPIRIFHDVGELEASITLSRWFDHVLTGRGYDTNYVEFAGGHDYAWWRGLFADALQWCFPRVEQTQGATRR